MKDSKTSSILLICVKMIHLCPSLKSLCNNRESIWNFPQSSSIILLGGTIHFLKKEILCKYAFEELIKLSTCKEIYELQKSSFLTNEYLPSIGMEKFVEITFLSRIMLNCDNIGSCLRKLGFTNNNLLGNISKLINLAFISLRVL
uniref:Uncharacterized protein n=1 Tax=Cryptosporidium parvum TaxID=5807 RepID=F0X5J2_CRYPV